VSSALRSVDLSGWWSGDPATRQAIAEAIDRSCRETGFLVLEGHGIPDEIIGNFVARCDEFFALPKDEKLACKLPAQGNGNNIGYTGFGDEASAYREGYVPPPDLFEAMSFSRSDAQGAVFDAFREWFPANQWPDRPDGWEQAYLAYEAAMQHVAEAVLTAMSLALGMPEGWLVTECADAVISARANFYRQPAGGADLLPEQMRRGAHTDFGVLTLLWTDGVPGLQIRQAGEWRDVDPEPGRLVANIGDLLAMWTNDRWTSTLHQVLPPPADESKPVNRRSLAYFVDAYPGSLIAPIPTCVDAEHPPRFEPVTAVDWLAARARRQLQSGEAARTLSA
jgi:isopenicillin N synthase-like dioxygenase